MIKDIKELKNHSAAFIEDFLKGCEAREKIDAYYVSVEIPFLYPAIKDGAGV